MLDVMDCIVSRTDVKEVEAVRSAMLEADEVIESEDASDEDKDSARSVKLELYRWARGRPGRKVYYGALSEDLLMQVDAHFTNIVLSQHWHLIGVDAEEWRELMDEYAEKVSEAIESYVQEEINRLGSTLSREYEGVLRGMAGRAYVLLSMVEPGSELPRLPLLTEGVSCVMRELLGVEEPAIEEVSCCICDARGVSMQYGSVLHTCCDGWTEVWSV